MSESLKTEVALRRKKDVYIHAGVIDSSYRGEVKVLAHHAGLYTRSVEFKAGQRIAQMVIVPYLFAETEQVSLDELAETERGDGGFGSTGQ